MEARHDYAINGMISAFLAQICEWLILTGGDTFAARETVFLLCSHDSTFWQRKACLVCFHRLYMLPFRRGSLWIRDCEKIHYSFRYSFSSTNTCCEHRHLQWRLVLNFCLFQKCIRFCHFKGNKDVCCSKGNCAPVTRTCIAHTNIHFYGLI